MTELLPQGKNPFLSLIILVGYALIGLFVFQFFAFVLIIPFTDMGLVEFTGAMSSITSYPELKPHLLFIQFMSSLGGFVLAPFAFIYQQEKRGLFLDFHSKQLTAPAFLLAIGVTLCFIVADSVIIEWNMNLEFPEPFQSWAKGSEEQAAELTKFLTSIDSLPYFIAVFVTVAILPAVGEELLFRGLVQKYFTVAFKNPHVAIWITAILFSAFHFQFFGFVPRMLLGALFGYLFYFSGNLLYAILGHLINNGLTVLMMYLYQEEIVNYDIENTESIPLESVGIFAILGIGLFVLYTKQFKDKRLHDGLAKGV
ncbi:CPBP family intramembrane glutamic endopeptidase [Reichenbachiella ulvae]|uniref:CPBP family intramembrane metalloprotease n=1 Tax=Reichenbachiella ulvae TaxID=2980104 RepID=A0ABT3CXP9_9BACT|nr:CPBP family intramembrane glutamic endopeptidase [Reichenbachiella ulvae]MCV9388351.1 CPBP family intramembrane metalloprotease [Reichenbachiella ulvae]